MKIFRIIILIFYSVILSLENFEFTSLHIVLPPVFAAFFISIFQESLRAKSLIYLIYIVFTYFFKEYLSFFHLFLFMVLSKNFMMNVLSLTMIIFFASHITISIVFGIFLASYFAFFDLKNSEYLEKLLKKIDNIKEEYLNISSKNISILKENDRLLEIERLRTREKLARELHDLLGHTISSSIIQIASLKIPLKNNPETLRDLNIVQDTLSKGLTEMREKVRGIKTANIDLRKEIEGVFQKFKIPKENLYYDIDTENFELKQDILRIIKESISNFSREKNSFDYELFLSSTNSRQVLKIRDKSNIKNKEIIEGCGFSNMHRIAEKYGGKFNYFFYNGLNLHFSFLDKKKKEH